MTIHLLTEREKEEEGEMSDYILLHIFCHIFTRLERNLSMTYNHSFQARLLKLCMQPKLIVLWLCNFGLHGLRGHRGQINTVTEQHSKAPKS